MKSHSEKFLQQRRFYIVVPVLVLPFLVMIFWALGGGKVAKGEAEASQTGLDLSLPDAHFPEESKTWNKLQYYEEAEKDSIKNNKARQNETLYSFDPMESSSDKTPSEKLNTSPATEAPNDSIEQKINRKLRELNNQIYSSQPEKKDPLTENTITNRANPISEDVTRLERMMDMMNKAENPDPEMQEIENVLDKILDIQHPDRAREKIRQQSLEQAKNAFPVAPIDNRNPVSIFGSKSAEIIDSPHGRASEPEGTVPSTGFFGIREQVDSNDPIANIIQAVIHDTQELMTGAEVRIRLLQDIYVNGKLVPAGEVIFGTCAVNGDRFSITVNAICLLPVLLKVYDINGLEGIHIKGSLTQDAANQGYSQAIQQMQLYNGIDPSLETQVATAGIQAVKGLFTKKVKLVKGTVKAGYRIVLKNVNN